MQMKEFQADAILDATLDVETAIFSIEDNFCNINEYNCKKNCPLYQVQSVGSTCVYLKLKDCLRTLSFHIDKQEEEADHAVE